MPIRVLEQIDEINQLHIDDDDKMFRTTAILAEMDYNDFINLPLTEAKELVDSTEWMKYPPKREKVKRQYIINGRKYDLFRDFSQLTTAQYIDFQSLSQRQLNSHLADLMAIALIPAGKKYNDGYDAVDTVEEIRNYLNVEEALAISDFFTRKFGRLMKRYFRRMEAMLIWTKWRVPKEQKEAITALMLQLNLLRGELTPALGYRWWKQWQK